MRIRRAVLGGSFVLVVAALVSWRAVEAQPRVGQVGATTRQHIILTPNQVQWTQGPVALGPGAMVSAIEGDPARADALFTLRAKLPAGWRILPHYHGADEHVTVLQGALHMGMGDRFNRESARALPVGGFAVMPKDSHHYAFAEGETIIQLHGVGPWTITYVNPADDPRNQPAQNAPGARQPTRR